MKLALLQLNVSDDPLANLPITRARISEASAQGAELVATPEVTNCLSASRAHQQKVLQRQDDDVTLRGLREAAKAEGVWLLIGSLALKTDDPDGRFANRSFLIGPKGDIVASYDKIHMFDVTLSDTESYRESSGYRPGDRAVVADTPFGGVGMTICYDVRFPKLYRNLAQAGAVILTVPAAFSPVTGAAHWEALLRARAIETGCFVVAPGQCGTHPGGEGALRATHGHSMVVGPWGEVLLDAGQEVGVSLLDIDLQEVEKARQRVPSLTHDRAFKLAQDD